MINGFPERRKQTGVTMIELMIGIVVLSIIAVFAVPSFQAASANAALRSTTMDLVTAINTARAGAVNLRVPVQLVPTDAADWSQGWSLVHGAGQATEDRDFTAKPGVTVTEDNGLVLIEFRANGTVNVESDFTICDGRAGERGRSLSLNRVGRMTNVEVVCP